MIPDEAVEAALDRLPYKAAEYIGTARMRAALEAAAPHMLAAAWDEGAGAGLGWDENRGEDFKMPNPYRPTNV